MLEASARFLSLLNFSDSNHSSKDVHNSEMKQLPLNFMQHDVSLMSTQWTLPTYLSHHLHFCLDNCSERDLVAYIKWKSEHDIQTFAQWMRIIASTLTIPMESESALIGEWYEHLLHTKHAHHASERDRQQRDGDSAHDSASEDEEQYSYSISTAELDGCSNATPAHNQKVVAHTLHRTRDDDDVVAEEEEEDEEDEDVDEDEESEQQDEEDSGDYDEDDEDDDDGDQEDSEVDQPTLKAAHHSRHEALAQVKSQTVSQSQSHPSQRSHLNVSYGSTHTHNTHYNYLLPKAMLSAAYTNNYVALSKTHRAQSVTLSNLLDLPSSWLLHLFSNYFDFHILLNTLPLVCHQFRSLSGDTNVWKSIKIPISVVRRVYADPSKPRSASSHATVAAAGAGHALTHMHHHDGGGGDDDDDAKEMAAHDEHRMDQTSIYENLVDHEHTRLFVSFLIRCCRLLQVITFEGSIEESDWHAWNHMMKVFGNHALRQIKWHCHHKQVQHPPMSVAQYFRMFRRRAHGQSSQSSQSDLHSRDEQQMHRPHNNNLVVIDTLFVRCRHISRRGYCWLQALSFIPTIEHIHCAALSRSDDVQHMIYHLNNLKTLNVNILGPRHPNRNFHAHHRLALQSIARLIPPTVTEFAIPVSVQEDFVQQCFTKMPRLENLDFFRLTTPHQNVDIDSWACCLSSESIYHLAAHCKHLKKCQLFVKCFKPQTQIWDAVKFLLQQCKGIHMLTIGMTESETLNGLDKLLPPESGSTAAVNASVTAIDPLHGMQTAIDAIDGTQGQQQQQLHNHTGNGNHIEYDKLSKRYFDQLKRVPFLRKRFRKFKKKTMKFPKFTIMWCLLT